MTVKELVELNASIGDITVEIRGKGGTPTLGYENRQTFSYLHKDWHIGAKEGKKPRYPSKVGVYVEKNINAKDNGKEYYEILINRIPKEILNLHVVSWHVWPSYRGIWSSSQHSLQHIIITAWTDETKEAAEQQEILQQLEKAAAREGVTREAESGQLPGQLDIETYLGGIT